MLFANKLVLSLAVALAFHRGVAVYGQDDTDSNEDTDGTTSATRTSTSASVASTANIDPCILQCSQQAAADAGCEATDQDCMCSSETFESDAAACVESQCSASAISQAQALQTSVCDAGGASDSAAATDTSRHLASTGTGSKTTNAGSATHSATTSATTGASAASGSVTNLATAGSDLTIPMSGFIAIFTVFLGIAFGALST